MLNAVLLFLLPSVLPVVSCQDPAPQGDPSLRWDGDTEDAYRRALHLWQVRGKPREAAEIFITLADDPEVIQVAGQASWVLVLGAQALAEAGRGEEASAMISSIERGARGTALEEFVRRELDDLRDQAGVGTNGLDPAFKAYFLQLLATSDSSSVADKYGRTLLPYILDLLESWKSNPATTPLMVQAVVLGWRIADDPYVDSLLSIAEEMTTIAYLTIFDGVVVGGDLASREASLRFWLSQSASSDLQRSAHAHYRVSRFLLEVNPEADQRILSQALAAGPQLLDPVLDKLRGRMSPSARSLLLELAHDAPVDQARNAKDALSRFGIEDAATFASSGELNDVARYLATIANIRLEHIAAPGSSQTTKRTLDELTRPFQIHLEYGDDGAKRGSLPDWAPPVVLGWLNSLDVPEPMLADESLRSLLAFAAVGLNDAGALNRALDAGPPRFPELFLSLLRHYRGPTCPNIWRDFEIYARLAPQGELWPVIRDNLDDVNYERTRLIRRFLPNYSEWSLVFRKWSELGRSDDLRSILLDTSMPWKVRQSAAVPYLQATSESAPDILGGLTDGWQSLNGEDRGYLVGVIRVLYDRQPGRVQRQDQAAVLELFYSQTADCFLVGHLLQQSAPGSWEPVLAFITDPDRARWMGEQIHECAYAPGGPAVAHAILRAGLVVSDFLPVEADSKEWIRPGSVEALESAKILLLSQNQLHRINVLTFLKRDPAAFLALQKELAPIWVDSELAAWLALTAADHARLLDPADRLVAAWQLPNLQHRSLVLRAMINTASQRFVPILLEAISDPDDKVAATAREGLQRLKEIEEQRAFWESWQATGVGGSPTAALLRQIRSENKEIRLSAIRALGAVKAPEALPLLISLLEDHDPEVVAASRAALRWLAEEPAPK
jgi:hypothetical protein